MQQTDLEALNAEWHGGTIDFFGQEMLNQLQRHALDCFGYRGIALRKKWMSKATWEKIKKLNANRKSMLDFVEGMIMRSATKKQIFSEN